MSITKKILRQLIIGKIMGDSWDIEKAKEANIIAIELINFMNEYKMFDKDIKNE